MREILLAGPDGVTELADALDAALSGSGPAVLPLPARDPQLAGLRAALAPDRPAEPGTAVVIATSGSTGAAKGVLLSGAALRASATATHTRLGGPGRWLLALPATHIAGVQVIVRALLAGHRPAVLPGGFAPDTFATAAAALLGTDGPHYTSLVPTQLTRLLAPDAPPAGLAALRGFDAVLVGGAALPPRLLADARAAGVRVVTTYGMSETAGGCVYDGVPLDGVRVRISGGLIEVAGPVLASGYRLDPRATAFAGGWFRTRDLGRWGADGALEVLGRADDVINTGGVKVSPAAVEVALTARPDVAEACVVDLPDAEWGQLVAAAVVPADAARPPEPERLRAAVRSRLGGPSVPRVVRVVDSLPRRGPGKPDRAAVRAALSGNHPPATDQTRPT